MVIGLIAFSSESLGIFSFMCFDFFGFGLGNLLKSSNSFLLLLISFHSLFNCSISSFDVALKTLILLLKVASSIGRLRLPTASTETQLELLVAELADVLSTAACESRCNLPSPQSRGMPWWNKDLCALRHKTRLAFKCWSANRSDENRKLFSSLKAVYQGELRRAKRQSWNLLCKASPNSNDLFSAIKELSGKARGISLPDAIVGNGSPETDAKLILNQCALFSHRIPVVINASRG